MSKKHPYDEYFDSLKGWDYFNHHYASPRPTLEVLGFLCGLAEGYVYRRIKE